MRKKYEKLVSDISEGKYTGRELVLMGVVLFLLGTVIGMFCSPRKNQMFGCYNGTNGADNLDTDADKEDEAEK